MIKAVVFDMVGVLIDAKEWHYEALNRALGLFGLGISRADHLTTFDGLPTRRKLEILSITDNLPKELHGFLNTLKQDYTMEMVNSLCKPTFVHQYALLKLKAQGYKLAVASNSVRATVESMMQRAHLTSYIDVMLSNEDVGRPKPAPDIYLRAMADLAVKPEETLIVEDNEHGKQAAISAGAHVLMVRDVEEVTLANLQRHIHQVQESTA